MNKPFTTDHLKWLWAAFKRNIPKKLSEFKNDLKVSDLEHDIHPDHSVNEPTDPSYIQNRTHYKETVKKVLLEETYYDHNTSSYGPYFPTGVELGDKIIVKWNGVEYPCIVEKDSIITGLCFGNKRNYHSSYDDTGEPFLIEQDGENGWIHIEPFVYPYDSVTFEIFSIEERYFTLDENFIPDTIARTNNIEKGFVKKDQYATLNEAGIVSVRDEFGTGIVKGCVTTKPATTEEILNKQQYYKPITPSSLDYAIKAGLGNNSLTWLKEEQAKARKTIGVEEPDWNETDDTSFGHIKNKPFYEIENEEILFTSKEIVLTGGTYVFNPSLPLEHGDVCTVIIDLIPFSIEFGKELVLIGTEYESVIGPVLIFDEEGLTIIQAMKTRFYLEIKRVEKVVGKQLDEKFIPDSIARKEDVPTVSAILNALPTWNGGAY